MLLAYVTHAAELNEQQTVYLDKNYLLCLIFNVMKLTLRCRQQKVRRQTLTHWLDNYLHGGFDALLTRMPAHRTRTDYGIDSYQWTAGHVSTVVDPK